MPVITIVDSADASGNTSFSLSLSGDVGRLKVDTLVAFVKNSMRTGEGSTLVLACHGRRLEAGHTCGAFGIGDGSVVTMGTTEASMWLTAPRMVETLDMPLDTSSGCPSVAERTQRRVPSPPPGLSPIPHFPTPGLRPAQASTQAAAAALPSPARETSTPSPASQRLAARLASVTIDSPSDRSPSERPGTPGGTLPPPPPRLSRRASMRSEAVHILRGPQQEEPSASHDEAPPASAPPQHEASAEPADSTDLHRGIGRRGTDDLVGNHTPLNASFQQSPQRGVGSSPEGPSPSPGSAPPARLPRRASMRMAGPMAAGVGQGPSPPAAEEAPPIPIEDANGGDSIEARGSPATPRRSSTPGGNVSPPTQLSRRASLRMTERPMVALEAVTPPSTPSERLPPSERTNEAHAPPTSGANAVALCVQQTTLAPPALPPAGDADGSAMREEARMREELGRWGAEAESAALAATAHQQQHALQPSPSIESPPPRPLMRPPSTPRLRPSEEHDGGQPTGSPSALPPARLSRRASMKMEGGAAADVRATAVQNDSRLSTVSAVLDSSGTLVIDASPDADASEARDGDTNGSSAAATAAPADTNTPPRTPTPGRGTTAPPPQLSRRASMKMTSTPVAPAVSDRTIPASSGGEAETATSTAFPSPIVAAESPRPTVARVDVMDTRSGHDAVVRLPESTEVADGSPRQSVLPAPSIPPAPQLSRQPAVSILSSVSAPTLNAVGAGNSASAMPPSVMNPVHMIGVEQPTAGAPNASHEQRQETQQSKECGFVRDPLTSSVARTLTLSPPAARTTPDQGLSSLPTHHQQDEETTRAPTAKGGSARPGRAAASDSAVKRTKTPTNRSATAALLGARRTGAPQAQDATSSVAASVLGRPRSSSKGPSTTSVAAAKRPSPSPSAVHRARVEGAGTGASGVSSAAERFRALTAQRAAATLGKGTAATQNHRGRAGSAAGASRSPARTKATGNAQLKTARLRLAKLKQIEAQYDELRETRLQTVVLRADIQALTGSSGVSSEAAAQLQDAQSRMTALQEDIRHTQRLLHQTQSGDALLLHGMHRVVSLIERMAAPLASHEAAQEEWCTGNGDRRDSSAALPYRILDALHSTTYRDACAASDACADHSDAFAAYGEACRLERSIYTALHDRVEAECLFHVNQSHAYQQQHAEHQRALDALQLERRHVVASVRNASIVLRRKGKDVHDGVVGTDGSGEVDVGGGTAASPQHDPVDDADDPPAAQATTSVPTPTPFNQDDLAALHAIVADLRREYAQLEEVQQAHMTTFIDRRRVLSIELQQVQHAAKLLKQDVAKHETLFALLEDRVHGMDPNEEDLPELLEQQFAEGGSADAHRDDAGRNDDGGASPSTYVPAFRRHAPRSYISSGRSMDATTGPTIASIARDEALLEDRSTRLSRR